MCGRYILTASGEVLAEQFDLRDAPSLAPRYNIAPSQEVPAILADPDGSQRILRLLRWGLIPYWARDPRMGDRMINARSETAAGRPAFREPFQRRRCLLPADGFFEWQKAGRRKRPHLIRMRDRRPFALAGLWDRWRPREGDPIESCTILTTDPNELVAPIHDRMPVILPPDAYGPWLDPEIQDPDRILALLGPYPAEEMTLDPVANRVNDPRFDDPACIEPLTDRGPGTLFG